MTLRRRTVSSPSVTNPLIGSRESILISYILHGNRDIMCSMDDNHVDVIRDFDRESGDNNISCSQGSLSLITDWFPHSNSMWRNDQSSNGMSGVAFTQIQFLFCLNKWGQGNNLVPLVILRNLEDDQVQVQMGQPIKIAAAREWSLVKATVIIANWKSLKAN